MPPDLLTALRAHLIEQAVGRLPRDGGPLPPIWLEREDGTPAPGETASHPNETGSDAVIALYRAPGVRSGLFEAWLQRPRVRVHIRTLTAPRATALGGQIRAAVIGVSAAPKVNWTMGGLQVIAAQEWTPLQRLPSTQGFLHDTSFLFHTYT